MSVELKAELRALQEMPLGVFVRNLETIGREVEAPYIIEAARRLSRYAPVRIDPEDESTWPTEEDYVLARVPSRWDHGEWDMEPCVEVWGHSKVNPCWGLLEQDHAAWIDEFLWWRRIDNQKPG